jgi:hypothetical protein
MKRFFLIFILPVMLFGFSQENEEVQILDELIASTKRQLSLQEELKKLVTDFHAQQDQFYKGPQTKELASQMVETASKILKVAEEGHYLHLFPPFFVEELKLFSGIAKKRQPL